MLQVRDIPYRLPVPCVVMVEPWQFLGNAQRVGTVAGRAAIRVECRPFIQWIAIGFLWILPKQ